MRYMYIDYETYSEEPIKTAGAYRYTQSPTFEILLLGYSINDNPDVTILDLARDGTDTQGFEEFADNIRRTDTIIVAHNAAFERLCSIQYGLDIPPERFICTATLALYAGFPESLDGVSKALKLTDGKKKSVGSDCIKFFCVPQRDGSRNMPEANPQMWEDFKYYLKFDVLAEREVFHKLKHLTIPPYEVKVYAQDQLINDTGVLLDYDLAKAAEAMNAEYVGIVVDKIREKYGITSLRSAKQLCDFIYVRTGREYTSIKAEVIDSIMEECNNEEINEVLQARNLVYKSSNAKYTAMLNCVCCDGRMRGLYRYYGAGRTGRYAGRIVQMQNLPQNHLTHLELVRQDAKTMNLKDFSLYWGDVSKTLSQLIRTAFVAPKGHTFIVADFSAIEARVLACLARETWRMDVFKNNGDIYVTSASMMFGLPIDNCGKGTTYRQRGKVAELALGYGGWVNALSSMDKNKEIPDEEKPVIVKKWREHSKKVVAFWYLLEEKAHLCVRNKKNVEVWVDDLHVVTFKWIEHFDTFAIQLPSGRSLHYPFASLKKKSVNGNDRIVLAYWGLNSKGVWAELDTYGGKLTENITQAISRDLLVNAMFNVQAMNEGIKIVGHVHDEVIVQVPLDDFCDPVVSVKEVCDVMAIAPDWAKPFKFPLKAEGFSSDYYKKD